jgi:hypothetical protein
LLAVFSGLENTKEMVLSKNAWQRYSLGHETAEIGRRRYSLGHETTEIGRWRYFLGHENT